MTNTYIKLPTHTTHTQDVFYLQDGIRCTKIDSQDPFEDDRYENTSKIPVSGLFLDLCKTYNTCSKANENIEQQDKEITRDQIKTHGCLKDDLTGGLGYFNKDRHESLLTEATDRNIDLLEILQMEDLDGSDEEELISDVNNSCPSIRTYTPIEPFHLFIKELMMSDIVESLAEHLENPPALLKYLISTREVLCIYYPFLEQLLSTEELASNKVDYFFLTAANYISRLLQQQSPQFTGFKASDIIAWVRRAYTEWYKLPSGVYF